MVLRTTRARIVAASIAGVVGLVALQPVVRGLIGLRPSRSRERAAAHGAQVILRAAELHVEVDGPAACPTLEGMIAARRLERAKVDDPWGVPYRINCFGDPMRLRVASDGPDRKSATIDDVVEVAPPAS